MINTALEIFKSSMGNTLVMFREKYYGYGVDDDLMNRSLTLGGYDSAWNVYLITSYLLDLGQGHFNRTKFLGLYQDYGNIVLDGNLLVEEL